MLTSSKIALAVALVLATASAAVAAPKHAVRHQNADRAASGCRHLPELRFGAPPDLGE